MKLVEAPLDQLPAVVAHYATVETLDQVFDWPATYPPDPLKVLWRKIDRTRATRPDDSEGAAAERRDSDAP